MMLMSKRADYGIRAMIDVATRSPDERIIIAEIAERQRIPPVFLAKIIPQLAKAGLLRTTRGVKGRVELGRSPEQINLLEIIEAVEGPPALNRCTLCADACDLTATCPIYPVWVKAQRDLNNTLASTRLADMVQRATMVRGQVGVAAGS